MYIYSFAYSGFLYLSRKVQGIFFPQSTPLWILAKKFSVLQVTHLQLSTLLRLACARSKMHLSSSDGKRTSQKAGGELEVRAHHL